MKINSLAHCYLWHATEGRKDDRLVVAADSGRSRPASMHSRTPSTRLTQADLAARRRREFHESMEEAATELLAHFNHKNLDSLLKVTRNTLESMKKRITSSSMVHYLGGRQIVSYPGCPAILVLLSSSCF